MQNDKRKNKNKSKGDAKDSEETSEIMLDKTMFKHLQTTMSILEGRKVSPDEITAMIKEEMRQHSIARDDQESYGDKGGP